MDGAMCEVCGTWASPAQASFHIETGDFMHVCGEQECTQEAYRRLEERNAPSAGKD